MLGFFDFDFDYYFIFNFDFFLFCLIFIFFFGQVLAVDLELKTFMQLAKIFLRRLVSNNRTSTGYM